MNPIRQLHVSFRFQRPTIRPQLHTASERRRCSRLTARPFSDGGQTRPAFDTSQLFRLTQPPDPEWRLGDGLRKEAAGGRAWKADEMKGWRRLEPASMDKTDVYKFMTSAITPRPIAFISSLSADGIPNLAPFSYFSMVAHNPPLMSVAFTLSTRKPKDTRENIKDTKEFVVNLISEPFTEAANATSIEAPPEVNEWTLSGLTMEPSLLVKPSRVAESAVSFECELFEFIDIKPPGSEEVTNTLALGLIKMIHVRNSVLTEEGVVDPRKLKVVSRLGGKMFGRIGDAFELTRPSWKSAKPIVEGLETKRDT